MEVVYHVGTEFHVILAMTINKQLNTGNCIFLCSNNALNERCQQLKEGQYRYINVDFENESFKNIVSRILNLNITEYITFLNQNPYSILLNEYFKHSTHITTSLVPDGIAAYTIWKDLVSGDIISNSLEYLKLSRYSDLPFYKCLKYIRSTHGSNSKYDHYFTFQNQLPYLTKLKHKFSVTTISKSLFYESLASNYEYQYKNIDSIENSIIIAGQNFKGGDKLDEKVLCYLRAKFPQLNIIYKKHPRFKYPSLVSILIENNIEILESALPLELFLLNSRNTIVMSPFSTVAAFPLKHVNYVWYYKLDKAATYNNRVKFLRPDDDVKIAYKLQDIHDVVLESNIVK